MYIHLPPGLMFDVHQGAESKVLRGSSASTVCLIPWSSDLPLALQPEIPQRFAEPCRL